LSYFYLLEGSKIFFLSTKCFIWIVHVLIYPWEFFWNFCDFLSIFSALNELLEFLWNSCALQIYFRKKPIYRIGPSPRLSPTRPRPLRSDPAGPAAAHRPGEAGQAGAAAAWGHARLLPPIKGAAPPERRPSRPLPQVDA
jgi:hypothetical protein